MGRIVASILFLGLAVVAGGCADEGGCLHDTDCPGDQVCREGICIDPSCESGCAPGSYCDGTECQSCTEARHCGTDCVDCTLGIRDRTCLEDSCGCLVEEDCAPGETCTQGGCEVCTPDCAGRCGGSGDGCGGTCQACPTGEWCDAQACRICDTAPHCGAACRDCNVQGNNRACVGMSCGCLSDFDCAAGETCGGEGLCSGCQPACTGVCGGAGDGCGGLCQTCPAGEWCDVQACRSCDDAQHCGAACLDCTVGGSDHACVSGACGCASDADCATGQVCAPSFQRCAAPVSLEPGTGWWTADNGEVYARAHRDGTLEVGRVGQPPFVMDRDPEDHDIVCVLQRGESRCDNLGPWVPLGPEDVGDARITQSPFTEGARGCVRTTFVGLPVEDTPGDIQATGFDLVWEVCLEPGSDEVRVQLSVPQGEYYGQDLDRLYFPYAPRLGNPGSGYAVLPLWHGMLLPVGWLVPSVAWVYTEGDKAVFHTEWEGDGAGWGIPYFGVVEGDGRALLVVVHTEADASLRVHQVQGGAPRVTAMFRASLDLFRDGGTRELTYVPLAAGNHASVALRYRAFAQRSGRFRSLEEKRTERPALDSLIGGVFLPASTCYFDVHNPCTDPDPAVCPCGRTYCNDSFLDVLAETEAAATATAEPLTRGVVHMDGWGQRGYDNLHPDGIFPLDPCRPAADGASDCGPCSHAGGWGDLATLAGALGRLDPVRDFQLELHDNYRDFYLDAQSYAGGADAVKRWDGQLPDPIDFWAGGPQQVLCASRALPYLQRNYDALAARGVVPGGVYLDVFTAVSADQCFDTAHRMQRPESLAHRATLLDALRRRGMITASEQMVDWAVPHLDHVYWSNYLRAYDPWASDFRYRWADTTYGTPVGVPAPLLELCYHDAILVPWPILDGDAEETLLDAWLAGGVPQVQLDAAADESARRVANRQARLHQAVGTQAMVSHRFLDDRFVRQEAEFSGGVRTRTDRDLWALEADNLPGQTPGPVGTRRRVSARVIEFQPQLPDEALVTLEWISQEPAGSLPDQQAFLHVIDASGVVVNADHAFPSSPSAWAPGVPVVDGPHRLRFPRGGDFELISGMYQLQPCCPRLQVLTPRGDSALFLGNLAVALGNGISLDARSRAEPRLVLARQVSDLEVEVMTEWWIERHLPPGQWVFFHAVDASETIRANADYAPVVPSNQWPLQARRRELRRTLRFDAGDVPGSYRLVTGVFEPTPPDYTRQDFLGADAQRRFVLGRLTLEGASGRITGIQVCPSSVPCCPDSPLPRCPDCALRQWRCPECPPCP